MKLKTVLQPACLCLPVCRPSKHQNLPPKSHKLSRAKCFHKENTNQATSANIRLGEQKQLKNQDEGRNDKYGCGSCCLNMILCIIWRPTHCTVPLLSWKLFWEIYHKCARPLAGIPVEPWLVFWNCAFEGSKKLSNFFGWWWWGGRWVVEYKKFIYSGGPGRVGSLSFWWLPPFWSNL